MSQEFNGNITVNGTVITGTKQLVRTATVVVGLESSGYTQGQVDVLIKLTDNVSAKITEAINKLPAIGGEIKILEGTYVFTEVLDIKKANVTFSFASWAAKFTGNISWLGIYSKGIIFNGGSLTGSNYIGTVVAGGEFILNSCYIVNNVKTNPIFDILDSGVLKLNGTINVDGILASKTASNWQNIWVDGSATNMINDVFINMIGQPTDTVIFESEALGEADYVDIESIGYLNASGMGRQFLRINNDYKGVELKIPFSFVFENTAGYNVLGTGFIKVHFKDGIIRLGEIVSTADSNSLGVGFGKIVVGRNLGGFNV